MRGLPGAGKSTSVNNQINSYKNDGLSYKICSTDAFFIKNGKYEFNPKELGKNHKLNQELAHNAMKEGINIVIIDNTNIRKRDYKEYINLAKEFNYKVVPIIIGQPSLNENNEPYWDDEFIKLCAERNAHGVPFATINRMAQEFEF